MIRSVCGMRRVFEEIATAPWTQHPNKHEREKKSRKMNRAHNNHGRRNFSNRFGGGSSRKDLAYHAGDDREQSDGGAQGEPEAEDEYRCHTCVTEKECETGEDQI